jgi:hypothetical protein
MCTILASNTKVQLKLEIETDMKLINESQLAIDRLKLVKTNKVAEQKHITKNLQSVTKTVINLENNINTKQMRLDLLTTTVRFKRNLIGKVWSLVLLTLYNILILIIYRFI